MTSEGKTLILKKTATRIWFNGKIVDRINVKMDIRTSKSQERIPVEHNKSREINPVVRTVSYSNIARKKILPNDFIESNNFSKCLGYQRATFVHLKPSYYWFHPCDSPVGGIFINSKYI